MKLVIAFCVMLFFASSAPAVEQSNERTHEFQTEHGILEVHWGPAIIAPYGSSPGFNELDKNKDGFISGEEAQLYQPLINEFDHADRNRDGKISKSEYATWN